MVLMGVLAGLGASAVILAFDATKAPVTVTSVRETDGVVVQGGRLNLFVTQDKYRDCPTSTTRYLWRLVEDPERPSEQVRFYVPLTPAAVPIATVGMNQRYIVSIALPSDIQEGEGWFYQSRSDRDCGWLPSLSARVTTQSMSVPLRVLSAEESVTEGVRTQEGTVIRPDLRP